MITYERRTTADEVELRGQDGSHAVLNGYASMFGSYSRNLGGFVERIDPKAFTKTIQEQDVRSLFNHDPSMMLGRIGAGTLRLSVDERGLAYENDLPNTTLGRDVAELISRGDIMGSSFGFRAVADSWGLTEDKYPLRTVTECSLRDIGPCTFPAYEATEGALSTLAARAELDIVEVRSLADEDHLYQVIEHLQSIDDIGRETPTELVTVRRRRVF